jgi:hypothetical protein
MVPSPEELRELVTKDDEEGRGLRRTKKKVQSAIKNKTPISLVERKIAFDLGEKKTLEELAPPAPQQAPQQPRGLQPMALDTGTVQQTEREIDTEMANAAAITALTQGTDVEHLSELDDREIPLLMSLRAQAANYKLPMLNEIADSFESLKVSRNRQSRRELIDALMARLPPEEDNKGLLSTIYGKLR